MPQRILAIEDNPDNMKLFEWIIEEEGYEFVGAGSAEEGLELLEESLFDLVVMDISLPGIDGKEATRRLRSDPRFAELPIIAATAHAVKDEEAAIRSSGVNDLLTKPLDEQLLIDTIQSLLSKVE